jgi:arginine decarboxylase
MDPDTALQRNIEQTRREALAGPARDEPDAEPVGEAVEAFRDRGDIAYAIPAHRSGRGRHLPGVSEWVGEQAVRADVATTKGLDTRTASWQVEQTAHDLFARAVGADQVLFSTNGSTQNVHVAMTAAVRPGETLVMARNGHQSAFSGLVLSGAVPVYVEPEHDERWQLTHGVDPARLADALAEHPGAAAAMVFSPTYYGVSTDVAELARVAHDHDVPLLTDDAWGLDYSFCRRLPPSAVSSGADLAIGSAHKSLNGLTQTSVLSRTGDRIDAQRLSLVFELFPSTSTSPLLLASIDSARREFELHGEEWLGHA